MKSIGKGFLLLAAAAMLLMPVVALAAIGPHDVTATTGSGEGACAECHNTAATAATRGWGRSLSGAPSTGWGAQVITALCWTCHSSGNSVGAHSVTATAMATGAHGSNLANAPPSPESDTVHDNASITSSSLPYTSATAGGMQCTSCHNVHNAANRPFNIKTSLATLCSTCHIGRNTSTVGTNNTTGTTPYSTHPVGIAVADIAGNGTNQFKTTIDLPLRTPYAAAPNYALGGKLTAGATGNVSCETCHAVHGDSAGTTGINDLLAINNYAADTNVDNNALCGGCHYGGKQGLSVGASTTEDHPIDNNTGRAFYPPSTALPGDWLASSGRIDRPAANFTSTTNGVPRCSSCHDAHGGIAATSLLRRPIPSTTGSGETGNTEWCWSCHGTARVAPKLHHSNTSTLAGSLVACSGCHGSTYTGGTIQQWSAHNGFTAFAIGPDTSTGGIGTGTLNTITANASTFENLCERCHDPRNPTVGNTGTPVGTAGTTFSTLPSRHGNTTGTQTHLTSAFSLSTAAYIRDMDRTFNTYFRSGTSATDNAWGTVNALAVPYNGQNIFSKYANYGTGTPQNPQTISGATGAYLVCESCHNLLTNAGVPADAADMTGGYDANLLVYLFEDDGNGNQSGGTPLFGAGGDSLCRGCHASANMTVAQLAAPPVASAYVHYPEAHTTNTNLYTYSTTPYGRSTNTVMTTPLSGAACPEETTADAGSAPGVFSYQADNRLNCDSCHRPHNADANGNNGVTTFSNTNQDTFEAYILEDGSVSSDNQAKTQACTQCHADRSAGQWHCLQ